MPQVNCAARLHRGRQRDIIDERAPDRADSADGIERLAPDQNRAAGGRGNARSRVVHTGERVEHLKEIYEGRHQGALGETNAMQMHHFAHHPGAGLE